MKKYTILAITLLAAISCAKETPMDMEDSSNILHAVILDRSPATRTVLKDNPGLAIVSQWQAGDAIGVFGGGSANQQYTLEAGTISQDGKSAGFVSTAFRIRVCVFSSYSSLQTMRIFCPTVARSDAVTSRALFVLPSTIVISTPSILRSGLMFLFT